MFTKETGIMLYVDDVAAEKSFWTAIGFTIFNESEMMGYETFDMKPHEDSTLTFTVYANEFIRQVSPEVIDMKPSVLFESNDIEALQAKVAAVTETASPVNKEPFPNFNFANPSGHYFAVKGV
ncbi:glyoxalase [Streptococcus gallolyticus]|uniref:glyoxalase n=1 Tax=Streptococcus hepaticus TaxID=3349163 RepID=UPI001C98D235|nr:glyoxalase [Streptococcus gallolyticus]MBY5042175.1 glyoxalase [Streptococcus gallolyticus]